MRSQRIARWSSYTTRLDVADSVAWTTKRAGLAAIVEKNRIAQVKRRRPQPPSKAELDRDPEFARRVQLFTRAGEVGVRRACDELGFQNTWYYRWKPRVELGDFAVLRAGAPVAELLSDRRQRPYSRSSPPTRERHVVGDDEA